MIKLFNHPWEVRSLTKMVGFQRLQCKDQGRLQSLLDKNVFHIYLEFIFLHCPLFSEGTRSRATGSIWGGRQRKHNLDLYNRNWQNQATFQFSQLLMTTWSNQKKCSFPTKTREHDQIKSNVLFLNMTRQKNQIKSCVHFLNMTRQQDQIKSCVHFLL